MERSGMRDSGPGFRCAPSGLQNGHQMDFGWPSDIAERIAAARQFAEAKLAAHAADGFDHAGWRAVADFGLIDFALPQAWGGRNGGALVHAPLLEPLGPARPHPRPLSPIAPPHFAS